MEPLAVLGLGGRTIKLNALESSIAELERNLAKIPIDISLAHFHSARQAAIAFSYTNGRQSEQAVCAGHLRDAYNLLAGLDKKTKRYSYIWGLISGENEIYDLSTQAFIIVHRAYISSLIERIYIALNEGVNSDFWLKIRRNEKDNIDVLLSSSKFYDWTIYGGLCDDIIEGPIHIKGLVAANIIKMRCVAIRSMAKISEDFIDVEGQKLETFGNSGNICRMQQLNFRISKLGMIYIKDMIDQFPH